MIRTPSTAPEQTVTTSRAHVEAVAERHGLPVVPAGEYLYAVLKVPALGRPIIYSARVTL
jgi:hypothetical protein